MTKKNIYLVAQFLDKIMQTYFHKIASFCGYDFANEIKTPESHSEIV